jgi:hypothetical protein
MAGRISMTTRGELLAAIGDRYRASGRAERSKILDEFVAVTGYHRKHAIRLLRPKVEPFGLPPRPVHRRYGGAVREALIALWEASDRLCSKRLKPIIPVLLPALERHGQLAIDEVIRERVLAISPATIDRLLSEVRLVARGGRRRRAGFSSAVRRTVPVRTFGDWNDPPPGFVDVEHRSTAWSWLSPSVRATMRRTLLTGTPSDAQPGGEAVEIPRRLRLAIPTQSAPVDPLAQFSLGGADFGDEHNRVGDGLQLSQPGLACIVDGGVRRDAIRRNDRRVIALMTRAPIRIFCLSLNDGWNRFVCSREAA